MKQLGDRRAHLRLEVVGTLWGTLELLEPADVLDINDTGVLLALRTVLTVGAVQPIALRLPGQEEVRLDVRVRHVRSRRDTATPEYVAGCEFLQEEAVDGHPASTP